MQMVSAAFNHLCEKLRGGEVTADVVQKLSQLVSDLANRNFVNASAIQTVSVLISIYSRIDITLDRPIFRVPHDINNPFVSYYYPDNLPSIRIIYIIAINHELRIVNEDRISRTQCGTPTRNGLKDLRSLFSLQLKSKEKTNISCLPQRSRTKPFKAMSCPKA